MKRSLGTVGQAAIVNFFRPITSTRTNNKRVLDSSENSQCAKRQKDDIEESSSKEEYQIKSPKCIDEAKPLMKESPKAKNGTLLQSFVLDNPQKQFIEDKKISAKIKLQAKKTPALSTSFGTSWFKALEAEFSKEYFQKLSKFLETERSRCTVFPPENQVYSWTLMCEIHKVKVVILGQDPYHGPNQAHGLAFSVPKGVPIPPSLVNMYKELAQDIPNFVIPSHGNLTGWAKQGVLLLNACLTVRAHCANSHKDKGWEEFTDAVIKWLNDHSSNIVFLLWGSYAQKKGSFIDKKKHLVLQCPHPSPLSASRGFFGCKHFSKANEYLKCNGKKTIDWGNLPIDGDDKQ